VSRRAFPTCTRTAHVSWANTVGSTARTAPARRAFDLRFEREVDPDGKLSPAERLENLPWQKADAKAHAAEQRAEARAKGYEGEACGECGNFSLVRNGTCMKCDTCGSTTGCS